MSGTKIEWATHTWNPIRGCTRISPGCLNFYAERMAARGLPGLNSPTTGEPFAVMTPSGPRWTGTVELIESQLEKPLRWRKPRQIFVNSISDTFHESVPDEWIEAIFGVMSWCSHHTFIVLTKRADRMRRWFTEHRIPACQAEMCVREIPISTPKRNLDRGADDNINLHKWPLPNVWLGVSVEDQRRADERIPHLLATPAAVRFVSAEPLLGPVDVARWFIPKHVRDGFAEVLRRFPCDETDLPQHLRLRPSVDWVIIGGESGPGARPCSVEHVDALVRQCAEANVACFVKQLGAEIHGGYEDFPTARHIPGEGHKTWRLNDPKGGDPSEWPARLRVRQYPAQMRKGV